MTQENQPHQCCKPASTTSPKPHIGKIHEEVRRAYGGLARNLSSCRGGRPADVARALGYSPAEIETLSGANLGLGCGNPVGHTKLREGDHVLDLGSGAGFDALIARSAVGAKGHVVGVDMTREMLELARNNAAKQGVSANVEFREGTIEALPVADATVDVAISNCVVNLSPDKAQVFREVHRVLKPGGSLVFSDILLTESLPAEVSESLEALVGCVAGAALVEDYRAAIREAGFVDISLTRKGDGSAFEVYDDPIAASLRSSLPEPVLAKALQKIGSYTIEARKPLG